MTAAGVLRERLEKNPPKTKAGDADWMCSSAAADLAAVSAVRPLVTGDRVLDVGCGYGRLALAFAGGGVYYDGVDINPGRLEYAENLFREFSNCTFTRLDMRNTRYNPKGKFSQSAFAVDRPDWYYAAVFAVSLYTHMTSAAHVLHYLRESRRLLQPGGVMLTTWLTSLPEGVAESTDHRAAHTRATIDYLLADAGFLNSAEEGLGTVESHLRIVSVVR
jgi:SAM-dependent methyltransferase